MGSLTAQLAVSAMVLLAVVAVAQEDLAALKIRAAEFHQKGDYAAALQTIFSREPKTLTGTAASEENVKREAVRPPALVFATPGYVLPDQDVERDDSARIAPTRPPTPTTGPPTE